MIRLVGPGGAGKTTTGALLAQRVGMPFIDLDERFTEIRVGGSLGEPLLFRQVYVAKCSLR